MSFSRRQFLAGTGSAGLTALGATIPFEMVLAQGAPIAFTFDGQTISAPTISEPWRSRFVKACGDLVHPGMRRRSAVSARVY